MEYILSKIIYITGIDGSGKTSLIQGIKKYLDLKNIKNEYRWMRYNHYLVKVCLALARIFGFTEDIYIDGELKFKYHHFEDKTIFKWFYYRLTYIDTLIAYILKIWLPMKTKKNVIILDRYIYDIIIDLSVDFSNDSVFNEWIARRLLKLIPKETKSIMLTASIETIKNRRPESLVDKDFEFRYNQYNRLARLYNLEVFSTDTNSCESIAASILKIRTI